MVTVTTIKINKEEIPLIRHLVVKEIVTTTSNPYQHPPTLVLAWFLRLIISV